MQVEPAKPLLRREGGSLAVVGFPQRLRRGYHLPRSRIGHIGKDDRPLPPSFRRRNPIFVLPLQRNGRHPVTIEPGLVITSECQYRFLFRLSYKNDGFRQIHAGGNGRSFLIAARGIYFMYLKLCHTAINYQNCAILPVSWLGGLANAVSLKQRTVALATCESLMPW